MNRLPAVRYCGPTLAAFLAAVGALSGAACVAHGRNQALDAAARACPAAAPASWQVVAPDIAAALGGRLVGTYDLVTVTTTRGREDGSRRARMRLAVTDSAERTGVRGFGPDGRRLAIWEQPVTAYIDLPGQAPGGSAPYVYRLRAGAFVQDERHLCNDCSATTYWLDAIGPAGLWGRWEHELAGIAVKGRDGSWHTRIAGRFCAYRVAPDSVPGA